MSAWAVVGRGFGRPNLCRIKPAGRSEISMLRGSEASGQCCPNKCHFYLVVSPATTPSKPKPKPCRARATA